MRHLLLPFFVLHLWLVQLPFYFSYLVTLLYPSRSFLLTAVIFAYFLYFFVASHRSVPRLVELFTPSTNQLETTLATWQAYYQAQPTHRDVLLNLSRLYSAQGDQENARKYLRQAQVVDPNNEIFTEDTFGKLD